MTYLIIYEVTGLLIALTSLGLMKAHRPPVLIISVVLISLVIGPVSFYLWLLHSYAKETAQGMDKSRALAAVGKVSHADDCLLKMGRGPCTCQYQEKLAKLYLTGES